MMSHLLCHILLLVFLSSRAVMLAKASNNEINCGDDNFCQATVKLMKAVNEMKNQLDGLATNVLDMQGKQAESMNRSMASTVAVNEMKNQLDELGSTENEKLDKLATDVNEKLDKQATEVNEKLEKQAKDLELLTVSANRSLSSTAAISTQLEKLSADLLKASTAAISTQLEKHSAVLLNHDGRLKTHDELQTKIHQLVQSIDAATFKPRDCSDIRKRGSSVSGVYRVHPVNDNWGMNAYCDFKNIGQSWLVFQRRKDGTVDFYRNWNDYANGFGDLIGEFWLGNEKLSLLTTNKKYKLRIELEDFEGGKRWAEYATFSVRPSTDKYRLTLGAYSGNAGDGFSWHNNMMFSTKDADNDLFRYHCAQHLLGGWWFKECHHSNLNGQYLRGAHTQVEKGISWYQWKKWGYSLKATEMKITAV